MSTNLFIINKNQILIPKLNKKIKILPKKAENNKININLDINKLLFDKQFKNFKSFSTMSLDKNNIKLNENHNIHKKPNTSFGKKIKNLYKCQLMRYMERLEKRATFWKQRHLILTLLIQVVRRVLTYL